VLTFAAGDEEGGDWYQRDLKEGVVTLFSWVKDGPRFWLEFAKLRVFKCLIVPDPYKFEMEIVPWLQERARSIQTNAAVKELVKNALAYVGYLNDFPSKVELPQEDDFKKTHEFN
jgi:hypothetical protein